jgi:outer membrane lipase/esterase
MKSWKYALSALGAALVLAGCGGGGGTATSSGIGFTSLVTFGDSLSDVGTHKVGTVAALAAGTGGGGRWTVNSPAGGEMWVDRLAKQLSLPVPCAAETGLLPNIPGLTGAAVTPHATCQNYAQGSARITSPLGPNSVALQTALPTVNIGLIAKPIKAQMAAHLIASGGSYSGKELVTVLAGANDVFMELASVGAGAQAPAQALANVAAAGTDLGNLIKTEVIGKGAKYVLVLNSPDVAGTPFVKAMPATNQGLVDAMVNAFNASLAASLGATAGVKLGDTYTTSKDQNTNPGAYGLSNVTSVACGPNALSSAATANGTSLVCNASNLLPGDKSRYQYADDVHPTPYGHQLLAQFAAKVMATAGWL